MAARTTLGPDLADLAASLAAGAPQVVVLAAPAGYGKGEFLRAFGAHAGGLLVCHLPTSGAGTELDRAVLDVLLAGQAPRVDSTAADRLAQRPTAARAASREAVLREWSRDGEVGAFVLHDPQGAIAQPAGLDLVSELIATRPSRRALVLSVRSLPPPALHELLTRQRCATVTAADLALRDDEIERLAASWRCDIVAARTIAELTAGWPLAARLLARLCAGDDWRALLHAAAAVQRASLLDFVVHRTIATLGSPVRRALVAAMLLREASHLDLIRVLGEECDDAVFAQLAGLPIVVSGHIGLTVHGEAARLLRDRFVPLVGELYERILQVLVGDGAYARAARIALDASDAERAAAIIDAAPPYTAAAVPLGEYERIVDRIDRGLITRYPNLWIATIPYRSFAADPETFVREAETVYFCLPAAAGPDQRATVLMLLASAYANEGRAADADQVIEEALHGFAQERSPARASVLNFAAALRGIEGRFSAARSLAAEAAGISHDAFGENQRLHYIDCHEAAYRGRHDRFLVMIDEVVRRRAREGMPLYLAYAAANGAIFSWAAGDDAAFQRFIAVLEDAVTPGIEAGFAPIVEAARGRAVRLGDDFPFLETAAITHLYRLGSAATAHEALAAARASAKAADRRGDPFLQVLAHVAIAVLDEQARPREYDLLAGILAPIESPELHAAIAGLIGGGSAGMLERFVRGRVLREHVRHEPRIAIELLAGHATRDGAPIALTDKEFELVALLASSRGMLSRERIGEALWDHLDPSEWANNFKVTLYRVRTKLDVRDLVLADQGRYRLAPSIEVDLRRAELIVREQARLPLDDQTRRELQAIVATYAAGAMTRYDRFAWAQPLLARIGDVSAAAGFALADDAWRRGRHDDALAFAAKVSAADPYSEQAAELTIRILVELGAMDRARREFHRYATALASGLGAAPAERLAALVRQQP